MIENDETTFQMVIIDAALPFGVEPGTKLTSDNYNNNSKCSKMHIQACMYVFNVYIHIS